VKVYRKGTKLRTKASETELASLAVEEFVGEEIEVLKVDFLADSHTVLLATKSAGLILAIFFVEVGHLSRHLAHLLQSYVTCRRNWDRLAQTYPAIGLPDTPELGVVVFTPERPEAWREVLDLISIPISLVSYQCVTKGNEQAIVLDVGEADGLSGKVSPLFEGRGPHAEAIPVYPQGSFFQRSKLNTDEIRALIELDRCLENLKLG